MRLAPLLIAIAAPMLPAIAYAAPATLGAGEQAQLQHNLDLGQQLYEYDQSAWHVTDAALAALSDEAKSRVRGYVSTTAPEGIRTTFFSEGADGYRALYSATWTGSAIIDARRYDADKEPALSAEELRLLEARKIALRGIDKLKMCSPAAPNVIVVPDRADSTTHVYVLTPQTTAGHYPAGGHHRMDVRDGRIVGSRDFSKSCIDLQVPAGGKKPAALVLTHFLDPVPTEIHVFTVFSTRIPLYVAVPDRRLYAVEISSGRARARVVDATKK